MADEKLCVLLVEDNPADVYFFKAAMAESAVNFDLQVIKNGREAWEHLENEVGCEGKRPDLVVLDLNLPGMSGREILAKLTRLTHLRELPIAILTSSPTESTIKQDFPDLKIMFSTKTAAFDSLKRMIEQFADFARAKA